MDETFGNPATSSREQIQVSDMDTTKIKVNSFLKTIGVKEDPDIFIEKISNIYHGFEFKTYDKSQVSIQLAVTSWKKAFDAIEPKLKNNLRILDYGTGTGFAMLVALGSSIRSKISEVVCYDLSPDMINLCKENLKDFKNITFRYYTLPAGREALMKEAPFDLVLTNALIHHIFDLKSFFQTISQLVGSGGYYIAGHEPNKSFYLNRKLVRITKTYQLYKKFKQKFLLNYWSLKLGHSKGKNNLPAQTNTELIAQKLIDNPIAELYVHKLIDIHVPFGLTLNQPWGETGFNVPFILKLLGNDFEAIKTFSYSHIKDGTVQNDWIWSQIEKKLQLKYSEDGADCLMMFRKKIESGFEKQKVI